ncbi:MAG: tRNA (adenosine(37)-N6)-dimethylallyltransferase MiaA [Cyanobacteria bacterium]|nr:tRNA (adenosine(37)-N6)-dimethylallyltransferase MiaA [Cyanobacteriota bacterium]
MSLENSKKPWVIAVVGPTGSGKSNLAVALAKKLEETTKLKTEIISADSQLVYRGLTIGTAKPSTEEQGGIPHHLIDCVAPNEAYSVARYKGEADTILRGMLLEAGEDSRKIPIVVGGTGFYLRALLEESYIPEVPPDSEFRDQMEALALEKGREAVYEKLQALDPNRANHLHPNDLFRVIRALEINHTTGHPVPNHPQKKPFNVCWLGLTFQDREFMRQKLNTRIEAMISAGWLQEVHGLIEQYGPEAEALQVALGYPEWIQYHQGLVSYEAALAQVQINTHQYARRQMTWFRKNEAIHWLNVDEGENREASHQLDWAMNHIQHLCL